MGQTIGKAPLLPPTTPFQNLPPTLILTLWESYNDIAEGFGLTLSEFQEILLVTLKDHLSVTAKKLDMYASEVFEVFDDDNNGLIDALEFLASFALLSGMTTTDKVRFVFGVYDFDESGLLSIDEMTLALRSSVSGVTKISGVDAPLEEKIERICADAFDEILSSGNGGGGGSGKNMIPRDTFVAYCVKTPEITSWINYYSDIPEVSLSSSSSSSSSSSLSVPDKHTLALLLRQGTPLIRTSNHTMIMETTPTASTLLQTIENLGPTLNYKPQQPWQNTITFTEPSSMAKGKNKAMTNAKPEVCVDLEWVHGLNCRESRQNVRYTKNGTCVVYPAGAVGVKLSNLSNLSSAKDKDKGKGLRLTQTFYMEHSDKITCLTTHHVSSSTTLVATGQVAQHPRINVWSTANMQTKTVLQGFHKNGVAHLSFNSSGTLLLSVGMDEMQSVCVYDWEKRQAVFTSVSVSLSRGRTVLDCGFLKGGDGFGVVGDCYVAFYDSPKVQVQSSSTSSSSTSSSSSSTSTNTNTINYKKQTGLYGPSTPPTPMLTLTSLNDHVLTGSSTGHLCIWQGRNCIKQIKAHSGGITCMATTANNNNNTTSSSNSKDKKDGSSSAALVTGSSDGKIQLWSSDLDVGSMFDISSLGPLSTVITSVDWDVVNKKLLVAMYSAEIYEIDDYEGCNLHGTALVSGHYGGGLHGLATNPKNADEYCTVGEDQTVRVWDVQARCVVRMAKFDSMARCVSYSPDGLHIAVGLGGVNSFSSSSSLSSSKKKDGAFLILNASDLTILHEARDSKLMLTDVKYSKDGTSLAFSSLDRCIYIYNTLDYGSKAKARGHKGSITHIDFGRVPHTSTAAYLQSSSDVGELMFWDIETGEQQTPRNQRDTEWESQTCVYGYVVKAAYGPYDDHADLLACARSESGEVMVTADVYGRIRVYRYPVVKEDPNQHPGCLCFRGHAACVSNVRFSMDDGRMVSTGEGDCCVFQWKFEHADVGNGNGNEEDYNDSSNPNSNSNSNEDTDFDTARLEANPSDAFELTTGSVLDKPTVWEHANNNSMIYTYAMEEQGNDEDFTPVKPWQRTIVAPQTYETNDNEPDDDLVLEWVHGYRGVDCRDNLLYGREGNIVYPVGNTVINLNLKENVQTFNQDANDEVISLAVHPTLPLCAVGQMGRIPYIHVFDYTTMETIQVFHGLHRRGVTRLKFSPCGTYIVSVGLDGMHTIVIHDWKNGSVKGYATSDTNKCLDIEFTRDSQGLIQVGVDYIKFWTINGSILNYRTASLINNNSSGKIQPFFCIGWAGNSPVVGTSDGHLYRFLGRMLDLKVKAHSSSVYCMSSTNDGIVTGARDGCVKIWSLNLECTLVVDMMMLGSLNPAVKSVCYDNEVGKILVGTQGNEIWEISSSDGTNLSGDGPREQGHGGEELWGLSVNPVQPCYATVGDDKTLRIWDLFEHKIIKITALEMAARACCYNNDGSLIAVGFGSPVKMSTKQFDGKWMIMSSDDFTVVYEARDAQKWITEIKWSPSGDKIAVGSRDNKIYLYNVDTEDKVKLTISLTAVINQHNSYITHFDFSSNGNFLQSNCGADELCYFESDTGMYIPAASRLKDTKWETQTCVLGWGVQGIWPAMNDGTSITTVDCNLINEYNNIVACSADNFGRIKIARYPCLSSFAVAKKYRGHAGHVSKVRWAGGDSHLISVGARDKGIFVWRHEADDVAVMDSGAASVSASVAGEDEGFDDDENVNVNAGLIVSPLDTGMIKETSLTRPWLSSILEPSKPPISNPAKPSSTLELSHAHGASMQTTRNAVVYNCNDDVIYPTAGICVVYNKDTHSQRFFTKHSESMSESDHGNGNTVSALCASPNGRFITSGETCLRPRLRVWDALTCCEIIHLPSSYHRTSITSISFNSTGTKIASVGADLDRSVCVWSSLSGEWWDGRMTCMVKGGVEKVLFAQFTNANTGAGAGAGRGVEGAYDLCTGGVKHVKFWTVNGANMQSSVGVYGNKGKVQTMLCGAALSSSSSEGDTSNSQSQEQSRFLTGSLSGHLYVWHGRFLSKQIRAHETHITSLHCLPNSAGIVTGSKDGTVKIWKANLEHVTSFDITADTDTGNSGFKVKPSPTNAHTHNSAIRSVCGALDSETRSILTKVVIGTMGSEVYEIAVKSGSILLLSEGHSGSGSSSSSGEVWGVCTCPTDPDVYATCGDDFTIRVWSVRMKRVLRKIVTDCQMRSIAWSKDGNFIIAGCGGNKEGKRGKKDGAFIVLETKNLSVTFEGRDSRHWIRAVKFSPDGTSFAVASMDQKVYLYETKNFVLRAKCEHHNASILALDWSVDSQFVRSDSEDYEHLTHNGNDGQHFALPSQLKNVDWATQSCVYGWSVQGIWPEAKLQLNPDTALPVSAVRRSDRKLLCVGSTDGTVKLYNYPVLTKDSKYTVGGGHVGVVGGVCFCSDGSVDGDGEGGMVSVGREDRTVLVWKVVKGGVEGKKKKGGKGDLVVEGEGK